MISQKAVLEYSSGMVANLKEMAEKMAQAARAGVAIEKARLKKILAERQKKSSSPSR
ncbi:MAG: hypothetical protein WBC78_16895 [Candidatus Sulfotelmatobacter sp.]